MIRPGQLGAAQAVVRTWLAAKAMRENPPHAERAEAMGGGQVAGSRLLDGARGDTFVWPPGRDIQSVLNKSKLSICANPCSCEICDFPTTLRPESDRIKQFLTDCESSSVQNMTKGASIRIDTRPDG